MSEAAPQSIAAVIDGIYRTESRRVFATLIRLLGDFDLAEEALHDAFRAALELWPREGMPANPRAWLVSAGRFKAIDGIRRRARFDRYDDVAEQVESIADESVLPDDPGIEHGPHQGRHRHRVHPPKRRDRIDPAKPLRLADPLFLQDERHQLLGQDVVRLVRRKEGFHKAALPEGKEPGSPE